MIFEHNKSVENISEKIGYVFAYFLFTTILFFNLRLTHKIPNHWVYFHVMGITLLIVVVGIIIKRLLK